MAKTYLQSLTADPDQMRLYQQERLIVSITELACQEMRERKLKRADLAIRLGKSKGRISQYLNGERNMTLNTVADIFTAMGLTLHVDAAPIDLHEPKEVDFISACLTQQWVRPRWNVRTPVEQQDLDGQIAG